MSSRTLLHARSFASFGALALAVASFTLVLACRNQEPLPSTDEPLAVLARATLEGPPLDVAPFAGKVVLVNFWSPT